MTTEAPVMDGLITFYGSHFAMRADKILRKAGFVTALVPGPREISPNCGVALQFEYRCADQVRATLAQSKVQIEAIHQYLMEMPAQKLKK